LNFSSKAPADEKEESIKKLMELCKGKMANLVYTHGTSRVLQCLLKLKKPAIRQTIFEELKPEILGMAKSRYAKYFVAKMLKYGFGFQLLWYHL
jgi:pumilio homology domain family member 6